MSQTLLRVGGVPEYFTMPWHLALERNAFIPRGVQVSWQDYPGGTGAMMQALREETLDVAVALTEGVVAEIVRRQSCRMVQGFVNSPLTWGVHTSARASFRQTEDLQDRVFAISRRGSGSHLMTYVLAQQLRWPTEALQFYEVGNLEGARQALASGAADGFLWERFTTQPLVDAREFSRVGTIDTPWPCFVVAARPAIAESEDLTQVLTVLNESSAALKQIPGMKQRVAQRYRLPMSDGGVWWSTRWATDRRLERSVLVDVLQTLHQLSIISDTPAPEQLCSKGCQLV